MLQNLVIFLALEDRASEKQVVKDDSYRKYIADSLALGRQIFDIDDLRSHKAWGTATDEQVLLLVWMCGQTEITNGQILSIIFPEDDVLRFEVAMDDVMFGEMGKPLQDILSDESDTIRIYIFIILDNRSYTLMT